MLYVRHPCLRRYALYDIVASGAGASRHSCALAGMDDWATHILYLKNGEITRFGRVEEFEELQVGWCTAKCIPARASHDVALW